VFLANITILFRSFKYIFEILEKIAIKKLSCCRSAIGSGGKIAGWGSYHPHPGVGVQHPAIGELAHNLSVSF
jgi:hypothetical protein